MEKADIVKLSKDEMRELARHYLGLGDIEFATKRSFSKQELNKILDENEGLSEAFNECLVSAFDTRMKRSCLAAIVKLTEDISTEMDFNKQRVSLQVLQTLMSLKKDLSDVKRPKQQSYMDVLEELDK